MNDATLTDTKNYDEADKILKSILYDNHHTTVTRPARLKDGILKLSATKRRRFLKKFKKKAAQYSYTDFIPASGSGTRLLQDLVQFAHNYDPSEQSVSTYINSHGCYNLNDFFKHLKRLPFYPLVQDEIKETLLNAVDINHGRLDMVKFLLTTDKLNLTSLPVALIPLHRTDNEAATAFDQHVSLHDALASTFTASNLTFTVPQKRNQLFQEQLESKAAQFPDLDIQTTIQDPASDVYCLNENNELAIDQTGDRVMQPSGHGSLLSNLNDVESEIIHISSVNNVPQRVNMKAYVKHKKIMTGYLIYVVNQVHKYLAKLENGELTKMERRKLGKFLKRYFHLDFKVALKQSTEGTLSTIYHLLNAPIRVAAVAPMKDNTGDVAFWATNSRNIETLQIINKNQIDSSDEYQKAALESASHYSFASMFLYTNDYKGNDFDLADYSEPGACTITERSIEGQQVKFIEQDGLWNAKMKDHLTIFIEADDSVFNPINDLTDLLPKGKSRRRNRLRK
ncbi:DUF4301 family protein [Nonlabens ponticola]|nr:DUF4301 family protein [Nonlabens ponticola]